MVDTPDFKFKPARPEYDLATIIGLLAAIVMISGALLWGGHYKMFWDAPSFLLVIGGTLAVTLMSTTWSDLGRIISVLKSTFSSTRIDQHRYAGQLIDLALISRQKGHFYLQNYMDVLRTDHFLMQAIRMVVDAIKTEEIEHLLKQEIDSMLQLQDHAVRTLRRAAEIAPAMGLIGTLVGLVQMLGTGLGDPSTIGSGMALALLTTFYGAILGTVILTPLATKLEKRTDEDLLQKILVLSAALSMSRQENPRHLEMQLNTLLAPKNRITYFEE